MSPAYQVVEAAETRRLPAKGDSPELAVDHLTLSQNGQQILVTSFRRTSSSLPEVGSTVEGELGENDRFDSNRRKFKRSRPGGGGGGFRKRDPGETHRIEMQSARRDALTYIQIKASLGKTEDFDMNDVSTLTHAMARLLDPEPPKSDLPLDDDGSLPPAP